MKSPIGYARATSTAVAMLWLLATAGVAQSPAPAVPFDVVEKTIPELAAAMKAGTVTSTACFIRPSNGCSGERGECGIRPAGDHGAGRIRRRSDAGW